MRLGGNRCDLLCREGKSDGELLLRGEGGERRVVIAGAVPDAVPGAVEGGERHDEEVGF